MGLSSISFTALAFCVASIVVQNSGELLVLRHLPNTIGSTETLTCISDDDDSAFIWNNAPRDFRPANPKRNKVSECAIWDSWQCRAHWGDMSDWKVVESAIRPMAPVFDFRWEGFKEYTGDTKIEWSKYQYLGKVNQSSGNAVFSVRGKRNVHIYLCEKEDQTQGPCFWIIIGGWEGARSVLSYCPDRAPTDKQAPRPGLCREKNSYILSRGILDSDEWRTFRLTWRSDENRIALIADFGHEENTILDGHVESWSNVSHMSVRLDETSRVRSHFYEYLLTEKSGSLLYTEEFDFSEEEFCVELLVGLCPKCELYANLVDKSSRSFPIGNISGDEKSVYNGMLTWRSMKLSKNININGQEFGKSLRLMILATLTGGEGEGRWAMDNFRMCKPAGQRRESTISLTETKPNARCQKLSYNGSSIVNPWSSNKIISNTAESRKFVDKLIESCGSSCESFGKDSLLCNSMGCSCNRGYGGRNCDQTCSNGHHGYNCDEICTPCIFGSCNKTTGLCPSCKRNTHLPPDCEKEIERPNVMGITDTTATVYQNIAFQADAKISVHVVFQVKSSGSCMNFTASLKDAGTPPYYESYLSNLTLDTIYTVHTFVSVKLADDTISVTSRETNFTTTCFTLLEFIITPGKTELNVALKKNKVCVNNNDPDCSVRILRLAYNETEWVNPHAFFPASYDNLTPYTEYRVTIFDMRTNIVLFEKEDRTLESAPPPVKELKVYEADIDTNTISLEWIPPNPAYGEIESYQVTITRGKTAFPRQEFKVSEEGLKCEFREGYVCLKNFKIPEITGYDTYIMKICAINRGIKEPGNVTTLRITSEIYNKKPKEPKNLTSISQSHGIMMLNWERQMFSPTKIKEFYIEVHQTGTKLKTNETKNFNMSHPAKTDRMKYSVDLHLLTSTDYVVSIVAINRRNITSKESNISISVPGSIAFANVADLTAKQTRNYIEIQIPAVVNATDNTTVKVFVEGPTTCTKTNSLEPSKSMKMSEWLAAVYEPEENRTENLTIGANYTHNVPFNCSLYIGETYTIKLVATDSYPDTSSEPLLITLNMDDGQSPNSNLGWLVIPPILAICLVLLFIGYRIRKKALRQQPREPSYVEPVPPSSTKIPTQPRPLTYTEVIPLSLAMGINDPTYLHLQESSISQLEVVKNESSDGLYSLPNEPDSRSVSIEYFEEYVKDAAASDLLYSQFLLLRRDLTRPYKYGSLPENMPKNRCRYQIAYDHSRVVLRRIPGDPYSDYINASYIKGYRKNRAYIAAEGPKPNTVNDFWRMVWQEEVRVICMLTNVTEDAEIEWEKYWPDVGTRVVQGDFHISNIDEQVSANYTSRTFELSHEQNTRKVTHLHYTEWPNLGVPTYPQSLVEYLKKLVQTRVGNGPVLVHCSTGDDRTGTVILCDICLHQAVAEKVIDVTTVITRMRDSRANMVGTLQQYVLAHIIITESIASWSTQIASTDVLSTGIKRLRMQLPHDIQRLNDSKWQEQALESSAKRNLPTAQEEASAKILDLKPVRPEVIYDDVFDKNRDQINAVSVDSFKVNKQYLACSLPSPLTLASFWGFIVERDIKLIIIMQCSDPRYPTCVDIMPDESIVVPMLDIQVENETSLDEKEYFTNEKLSVKDASQGEARSQSVAVLTCKGWGCGSSQKPPPPATLISLWRASEKIPRKKGETLVLCHDGITGCGLYLALSFLLEQMTVERECNVISAVRSVRRSEREFVQSQEQFGYLYDAAVNYSECFLAYANLS